MQTLKTAAIVILLMTVMYGAYVSLTTPPEPHPGDIDGALQFDDEGTLVIDAGLPDTLGGLDVDTGTAVAPSNSISGMGLGGSSTGVVDSPESGVTAMVSDSTSDFTDLPTPGVNAAGGGVAGNRSYPNTGDTFEVPDPTSIPNNFVPAGVVMPEADVALASGTTNSQAFSEPAAAGNATGATSLGLANAVRVADQQYGEDKRKEALATLSLFYNVPNLSGEQRSELLSRLDPLAREVIYSKRHLLEQAHRVGQNETLIEVAQRYDVPWQLLANINQINDPITVLPGTELKVVRGPFRAEVNLSQRELTLFLGDLYAGRFVVGIGSDPPPQPGTFTVQDKQTARTFYDTAGSPIPANSPTNPYGNAWIDLGGQLCIHGSPSTTNPTEKGCISLAADYADDLYGILSQGSSVTIRR